MIGLKAEPVLRDLGWGAAPVLDAVRIVVSPTT
jgi:hypothetical protein